MEKSKTSIKKDLYKEIIKSILKDYGNFSVKTIDSFIQQALQLFFKKSTLSEGLEISLSTFHVLKKASCVIFYF